MSEPTVNYFICRAKHRRSAVLVTEYLRDRFAIPHSIYPRDAFSYVEHHNLGESHVDHYQIVIKSHDITSAMDREEVIMEAVRAFLAGLGDGDIWA